MNSIIMQLKIEKQNCTKKLDETKIKLLRLLNELAKSSCPYFESAKEIKAEEIKQIGDELLLTKQEALKLEDKLFKIKRDLGENV